LTRELAFTYACMYASSNLSAYTFVMCKINATYLLTYLHISHVLVMTDEQTTHITVVVIWRRNRFWNRVPGCWNRVTRIQF